MQNQINNLNQNIAELILPLFLLLTFISCSQNPKEDLAYQCPMKCEGPKTYTAKGSCPVCKMNLVALNEESLAEKADPGEISETSIFNLTSKWNTQNGDRIELKDLKGHVLIFAMIYTSCEAACPRLVSDVRRINAEVRNEDIRYVFVSIDPQTDTPQRLKKYAIENNMDSDRWVFLQGSLDDVREFSNVLSVKYNKISPMLFSHSNIISIFDQSGELQFQREGLGVSNDDLIEKIRNLTE